jgi:hypothetical protein
MVHWLLGRHKITQRRSLEFYLLLDHRRFVCLIDFLVWEAFFFYFCLFYFGLLHNLIFLYYCLCCFLACFNCKCGKSLIMLTTRLRLFVTLCTAVSFRVVEYYFSLLIEPFDFTKLDFPLFGWHHRKITLASVWKIKNKFPFVYSHIKLSFFGMFSQAWITNIEWSESKPRRSLNHRVILCIKVYCTTK